MITQKIRGNETDQRYGLLQFMVDCVVVLRHPVVDGSAFRSLRLDLRAILESSLRMARSEIRHRAGGHELRRGAGRGGQRGSARPGLSESDHQCGAGDHRGSRRAERDPCGHPARERSRGRRGPRHRAWNSSRGDRPDLRRVLHDEGGRCRHGARPRDLPSHRDRHGWRPHGGERARRRHDVPGRAADRARGGARGGGAAS